MKLTSDTSNYHRKQRRNDCKYPKKKNYKYDSKFYIYTRFLSSVFKNSFKYALTDSI